MEPDLAGMLARIRRRIELRDLARRGLSAVKAGRPLEGAALFRRAYELSPNPSILYNLARAYEDGKDVASAVATFVEYLKTNPPDGAEVRERLARLVPKPKMQAQPDRPERQRTQPSRRRPASSAPEPSPLESPPSEAPKLDDEALASIAEAVAARLLSDPMFKTKAPPVAVSPLPGESMSVLGVDGDAAGEATAPAARADVADPAPEEIQVKTDNVYDEVVITASRRESAPLDAPNAVTIIDGEELALSGARSIPDILRRVPGMDVMAMSFTDYNVAARGFNRRLANKLLVLVDGQSAVIDFLGYTSWRTLPVELADIDRIEVIRGPGSAVYGANAYTGIVNIITKRPSEVAGSLAEVAVGNGGMIEGTFQHGQRRGNFGYRLSGGYQRANKYEVDFDVGQANVSSNVSEPEESLEIGRAIGQAELRLNDGTVYLGGSVVAGTQEFFGVGEQRNIFGEGFESYVRTGYVSDLVSVRALWSRVEKATMAQSFSTGTRPFESFSRSDFVSIEPIVRPTFELLGTHEMVVGAEYRFKDIEWGALSGPQTENHFAAYFQDSWRLAAPVLVVVSGRLDLHPLIGPLGSPRLAFIWRPTDNQAIRLSAGTAFRQPTMAESYLQLSGTTRGSPGAAITLIGGGADLAPENIATFELGYRLIDEAGQLEWTGYFNRVSDLITRAPLEPDAAGTVVDELDAIRIGRSVYVNANETYLAVGSELSGRLYLFEGLDVGASYSFQYIWDEATAEQFTDTPVHKAAVWTQLRTSLGLDVGLSGHFASDQAWVEPAFDPASPTGFDTTPLPLPATVTVLARVGYRFLDDQLEAAVSGFNLLDAGDNRQREHPFGNRREARVFFSLRGRI